MSCVEIQGEALKKLAPLVEGWEETMLWSCLQGHMGQAYGDCLEAPVSGQFLVGDFCFLAGVPNEELVRNRGRYPKGFLILCSQSEEWDRLIEKVYPDNAKKVQRFAMKKEPGIFCVSKLRQAVESLPEGYVLADMDERLCEMARQEFWSRDLCSQFADSGDYCRRGLGVGILQDGRLVAGASSYTVYDGGIEIEIDTKKEHRRKGLAYAAGAGLLLKCLSRGLYPSWDAQNPWSRDLAIKLGYHFSHTYTAYEVTW